jgi:hypothetical protein
LAALTSALKRLASSLARALLTVFVTIFINALVTFRSQYPERPPSAAGIQWYKKNTQNRTAARRKSAENTQITRVKHIPERISAC